MRFKPSKLLMLLIVVGILSSTDYSRANPSSSVEPERSNSIRELKTTLIFLIDVSGSVDSTEWRLQASAYAAVLSEESVQLALEYTQMAVILYSDEAKIVCPFGTAQATAVCMLGLDRFEVETNGTCPGEAMRLAHALLSEVQTPRIVIDVSGDGVENCHSTWSAQHQGIEKEFPDTERDMLINDYDAEINGLVILSDDPDLEDFYREYIIGNPGFVIPVAAFEDMTRALRAKIILEVVDAVE